MLACFFSLTAIAPKSIRAKSGRSRITVNSGTVGDGVGCDVIVCVGEVVGLLVGF